MNTVNIMIDNNIRYTNNYSATDSNIIVIIIIIIIIIEYTNT